MTIEIQTVPVICYSAIHCGYPIVKKLRITNSTDKAMQVSRWSIRIKNLSQPKEILVPEILPGHIFEMKHPDIICSKAPLERLTQPDQFIVEVIPDSKEMEGDQKVVPAVGFYDWPVIPDAMPVLAAFVNSNNPVVEQIVFQAEKHSESYSFRELLRTGTPDIEKQVCERVYQYLKTECQIQYLLPKTHALQDNQIKYQTIRPAHRIFNRGPGDGKGAGTCLDLAILFAAILENIGLCPLIFLTGPDQDNPDHAFTGCWAGASPGSRPVIVDKNSILDEVKNRFLYIFETTGMTRGTDSSQCGLDFKSAMESALKRIQEAPCLAGIDIKTLRPSAGTILPFENAFEPEVSRVLHEARSFTIRKQREIIEISHLLYGFIATNTPVMARALSDMGLEKETILTNLDHSVRNRNAESYPVKSKNLKACIRLAEDYSWQNKHPSVREIDLIWALIIKGNDSRVFRHIALRTGIKIKKLSEELEKYYPKPESPYPSTSLDSGT